MKMADAKGFIREHKEEIILGGAVLISTAFSIYVLCTLKRTYVKGGIDGFNLSVKWLDQTFPDKQIAESFNTWVDANTIIKSSIV